MKIIKIISLIILILALLVPIFFIVMLVPDVILWGTISFYCTIIFVYNFKKYSKLSEAEQEGKNKCQLQDKLIHALLTTGIFIHFLIKYLNT